MELSSKQKHKIKQIAQKYNLRLLLLFGSRAEGTFHEKSDYDIAYLTKEDFDLEKESSLNFEFTLVFGHDEVDTVDLKKAAPLLFYAVFKNPQVLFAEDDLIFPRYRAYAFKKYVETKPLYEYKFQVLNNKLDKIKT